MPKIELVGLSKSFGGREPIKRLSGAIEAGKLVWLRGPSGAGKTTLLRLIAGLEAPDAGEIKIDGVVVSSPSLHVAPRLRGIGMVFQDFALWPHLSARGHLDFVFKARGVPPAERDPRAQRLFALVKLFGRDRSHPAELSGGERQRLAIARALAGDPAILLLDEPFSNLDDDLARHVIAGLTELRAARELTMIVATHDQDQLPSIADQTIALGAGPGDETLRRDAGAGQNFSAPWPL